MNGVTETSHSMKKKTNKTFYIISWKALEAFLSPFLVLNNQITLCMNRINYQNDHSKNFVGTSNSNILFFVKLIWNFLFRPESKINFRQKKLRPWFSFLNFAIASVEVKFCYGPRLQPIGSSTKLTIYDFHHARS